MGLSRELTHCTPTVAGLEKALQAIEKADIPTGDIVHFFGCATATALELFTSVGRSIIEVATKDFDVDEDFMRKAKKQIQWRRVIAPQLQAVGMMINHALWVELAQ